MIVDRPTPPPDAAHWPAGAVLALGVIIVLAIVAAILSGCGDAGEESEPEPTTSAPIIPPKIPPPPPPDKP